LATWRSLGHRASATARADDLKTPRDVPRGSREGVARHTHRRGPPR
jgi:hypothetical protein